jgi:hypothetical protein
MDFAFYWWPKGAKQVVFCEAATKGSVLKSTTPIFIGGGSYRKARSRV